MKLASIEPILLVETHSNADSLEIVQVKGYKAIVKKGEWKQGDLCIFIEPDSVLPVAPWTAMYKAKSSRVKAIKLRGTWSFGIVESAFNTGYTGPMEAGLDVTDVLGITKYEPPQPQDLSAKGLLPFNICKTDEERYQSLDNIPWGATVDVLQKLDGSSTSYYWLIDERGEERRGILGRTLEWKDDSHNFYTQNQANYDVLNKLSYFCRKHNYPSGICVRGESTGPSIQKHKNNPHSQQPLAWSMFSVWLVGERRYARKGEPFYFLDVADELKLPTVPVIERNVVLTQELVKKYSEDITTLNGKPFEGVVIQHEKGSFKVINLNYDSTK